MVDSVVLGSISNVLRLSSRGTLRRGMTSGTRIQTWQMEQPGINRKIICSGRVSRANQTGYRWIRCIDILHWNRLSSRKTENDATQRQGLHSKLPVERQLANEIDEEANYLFLVFFLFPFGSDHESAFVSTDRDRMRRISSWPLGRFRTFCGGFSLWTRPLSTVIRAGPILCFENDDHASWRRRLERDSLQRHVPHFWYVPFSLDIIPCLSLLVYV